jgi:hypothetical protein
MRCGIATSALGTAALFGAFAQSAAAQSVVLEELASGAGSSVRANAISPAGEVLFNFYTELWLRRADGTQELLGARGDPTPGVPGTTIFNISSFWFTDAGQIPLRIALAEPPAWRPGGLWLREPTGDVQLLLKEGDLLPGEESVEVRKLIMPDFNRDGVALLDLQIIGPDIPSDEQAGLWKIDALGQLTQILQAGWTPPGAAPNEVIRAETLFFVFGGDPSLNLAGQLTFHGRLEADDGSVDASNDRAIFAPLGAEPFTLVAREGSPAPGAAESLFRSFEDPHLDESGGVAFLASLVVGTGDAVLGNDWGLWRGDPAAGLSLALRIGDPAPGTDTHFLSIERLTHNEVGEVAFYGFLDHLPGTGTANDEGIWRSDGSGGFELVVREGDPALLMAAGSALEFLGPVVLNNSNEMLFLLRYQSGIGGVTDQNDSAIFYVSAGGSVSRLIREGDVVEVAPGVFHTFGELGMAANPFKLNDQSQFIFESRHFSPVASEAIFLATISP